LKFVLRRAAVGGPGRRGGGEAREQQYAFMKINVVFMKNDGEKKGIIVMV
jgi:hypothetical protein